MQLDLNHIGSFIPSTNKKIFLTLFFAIFATVIGVGIVIPLLPIYANDLGATGIYIGMIFGSFSISRTLFLPFFGRMSDKKGRKPFITIGLLGYSFISIAYIFSPQVYLLIGLRFIQGIASAMIIPVVQAYIGEITNKGQEGYSMGIFNMSLFASLSIGPLMGGIIKDLWSMNGAFICMGLLSFIGFLLSLISLPPAHKETNYISNKKKQPIAFISLIKDKKILSLLFFRGVYTTCIGVIWCFLPLYAEKKFALSGSQIGLLVTTGVLISGILHPPMGWVSDRFNKKLLVVSGGIISSFGMLMLYMSNSYYNLLIGVIIFGLGGGISMPSIMAMAVIIGESKKAMASVMSIVTVAHSLGMFLGSITTGFIMDYFDLKAAFPFSMIIMIIGTFIFFILNSEKSN